MRATTARPSTALGYLWVAGIAGGLVGGVGMGVILHAGANVMPLIGALYGHPTVLGGWLAHLVNSVLIGLLFVVIVSRPFVRDQVASLLGWAIAGMVYGAAVGLGTSGIMLPIAMNLLGTSALPEPLLPLPGVIGGLLVILSISVAHLVYGLLLGASYGYLTLGTDTRPAGRVS